MLILGAAYVALARGIPWSIPIFALGFGLVLTLIRVNRRYRHASPSLRRTIDFSDTFLNTSLLAGVLIVCNVLAFRYGSQPIDMTREGTYSLSSLTLNQLKSLDRPLTFTIIFGHGPLATSQRDRVKQLLEAYRDANPQKVRIERLDPYTELSRVEELAKRVPDLAMMRGGGVLLEYGEGTEAAVVVVRNQEMFVPISVRPAPRRHRSLRIDLHGRRRYHVGRDADPGGEEPQGGLHQGAWGTPPRRPVGQGTRQLEGPAEPGRMRCH